MIKETKKKADTERGGHGNLKSKILVALLRDDSVETGLTWRGHSLHSKSY